MGYSLLDKWDLSRIIRQTDRQNKSVLFSCVQSKFHNAISRGALRPRVFRGRGASFLHFDSLGVWGEGVFAECIAMKPALRCLRSGSRK